MTLWNGSPHRSPLPVALAAALLSLVPALRADTTPAVAPASSTMQPSAAAQPPTTSGPAVIQLTGDLVSIQQVRVFARVAGPVLRTIAHESSCVKQGEVLAELDPVEFRIVRDQAASDVAIHEARVRAMDVGGRPEEKSKAAAEVAAAQAVLANAEQNLSRIKGLFGQGGASRQSVDLAQRERDVAASQLTAITKGQAMVNAGPRTEDREVERAELAKARARLEKAELDLEYTKVRAPFTGVVGQKLVDAGAFVLAASSPQSNALFTLADSTVLKAMVDVPEADLMRLRVGARARVRVRAYPGETFNGTIANVHPYVDTRTRTTKVEVHVKNWPPRLLPGMFADVEIEVSETPGKWLSEVAPGLIPGPGDQ